MRFGSWPLNIGIVTGAISSVLVVDADSIETEAWPSSHLPKTPWMVRTSRGRHRYYRHPGARVPSQVARGDRPEVKGDGAYAIGPGSLHETGVQYEAEGDWAVSREALPLLPLAMFIRTVHTPSPISLIGTAPERRARAYLARVPRPVIGAGSDKAMFTVACKLLLHFGVSEVDAATMLWEWAGNREGWDIG